MRKNLLLAGFAAAALIPSLAMAQESCEQRSANRAAGTAIGAVAGALLGSAVAGHGDKGTGAVVGGVGGAIIGNQAARGPRDCAHAYGYYDNDGRWHDNGVDRSVAYGYYDRGGAWVDGYPPGVAGYSAEAPPTPAASTPWTWTPASSGSRRGSRTAAATAACRAAKRTGRRTR